jgi:hypothetical protein
VAGRGLDCVSVYILYCLLELSVCVASARTLACVCDAQTHPQTCSTYNTHPYPHPRSHTHRHRHTHAHDLPTTLIHIYCSLELNMHPSIPTPPLPHPPTQTHTCGWRTTPTRTGALVATAHTPVVVATAHTAHTAHTPSSHSTHRHTPAAGVPRQPGQER